jgi:hypothetical protein
LSEHPDADERARRPRFGSTMERHRAALRRTLDWAEDAANDADYATALAWLATIEAVEGELPKELEARRHAWGQRRKAAGPSPAEA